MPRMPDHEMSKPLPTEGRNIGRGVKTQPAFSPSDDGIEGHLPGDPDDDHRHEDNAGNGKVSSTCRRLEACQNRTDLQAEESEGQHVQ